MWKNYRTHAYPMAQWSNLNTLPLMKILSTSAISIFSETHQKLDQTFLTNRTSWTHPPLHLPFIERSCPTHVRHIQDVKIANTAQVGWLGFYGFFFRRETSETYCWWKKSGVHQLRLVVYPSIFRALYIPGGCWGFLPPTVVGGWTNPSEKYYARQIGSFPSGKVWKLKIFELPPS